MICINRNHSTGIMKAEMWYNPQKETKQTNNNNKTTTKKSKQNKQQQQKPQTNHAVVETEELAAMGENDNNSGNSDFTDKLVLAKKTTVKQATKDIRPQRTDTATYARYICTCTGVLVLHIPREEILEKR